MSSQFDGDSNLGHVDSCGKPSIITNWHQTQDGLHSGVDTGAEE